MPVTTSLSLTSSLGGMGPSIPLALRATPHNQCRRSRRAHLDSESTPSWSSAPSAGRWPSAVRTWRAPSSRRKRRPSRNRAPHTHHDQDGMRFAPPPALTQVGCNTSPLRLDRPKPCLNDDLDRNRVVSAEPAPSSHVHVIKLQKQNPKNPSSRVRGRRSAVAKYSSSIKLPL